MRADLSRSAQRCAHEYQHSAATADTVMAPHPSSDRMSGRTCATVQSAARPHMASAAAVRATDITKTELNRRIASPPQD